MRPNISEGALLLQLILQYVEVVTPQQLEKMLQAVLHKIPMAKTDYLKAR